MKRFKIKNQASGLEFLVEGTSLGSHQPEWGQHERDELDAMGKPTGNRLPAEYTIEIEDIGDELERQRVNAESLAYLASTDWLIIREMDEGTPCPPEIRQARAEARARIVK